MAKKVLVKCPDCDGRGSIKDWQLNQSPKVTDFLGSGFLVLASPLPPRAKGESVDCTRCLGKRNILVKAKKADQYEKPVEV